MKYPNIIYKSKDSIILILNNINEMIISQQRALKNNQNYKIIFVQIIGLLISYVSNKRKNENKEKQETNNETNILDIENNIFKITFKIISFIYNNINDKNYSESIELMQKLFVYLREIFASKNNFRREIQEPKPEAMKYIHMDIYLLMRKKK